MGTPENDTEQRLGRYREMRRFDRTPEPEGLEEGGGSEAPAPGHRFVVQRHRARRLHYDLRLEVGGVLVSWAVPKGPTLDPDVRRMAVHVEDHPIEYFDFEGIIPTGEYGGGDVIVWDWGTWSADPGVDLEAAVADGSVHVDLDGEKLAGRFALVRRGSAADGKEQWLLIHKHDVHAVDGWDAEDHPRSVKSGRTNEEVAALPDMLWRSGAPAAEAAVDLTARSWAPPTEDELDALAGLGGDGEWTFQDRSLRLTNLDKVLFPARDAEGPVTKRDLIRYHAEVAPHALAYLADRAVNMHRFPDGVDAPGERGGSGGVAELASGPPGLSSGADHKEMPSHAPQWLQRWRNPAAGPGEAEHYPVVDSPPALAWAANYGAVELNPWTSTIHEPDQPTWALVDIDPGERTSWEDLLVIARLHRTALEHLGLEARPKVSGRRGIQIWIPVARGYSFTRTREWVEKLSRAVGATVPGLVSWAWRKQDRDGLARLDYTQNARNKTLVAPYSARPSPGAPVSVPIEWDELDDPDLRPDRWSIRSVTARLAGRGDPLRPLVGLQQVLPDL